MHRSRCTSCGCWEREDIWMADIARMFWPVNDDQNGSCAALRYNLQQVWPSCTTLAFELYARSFCPFLTILRVHAEVNSRITIVVAHEIARTGPGTRAPARPRMRALCDFSHSDPVESTILHSFLLQRHLWIGLLTISCNNCQSFTLAWPFHARSREPLLCPVYWAATACS